MRTMVFDVPAAAGGAMTILQEYHQKALDEAGSDNEWVFVLSLPQLGESEHVKVLRYPWIKKSWFHRLWFDYLVAPRLVRRLHPDALISLQNVLVPRISIPQTLYLHQPLPFIEKKYGILRNLRFWMYQNLISRQIYHSVRKAVKVTVQTEWMKEACLSRTGVDPKKIEVVAPEGIARPQKLFETTMESLHTFFYPASGLSYKNHEVLVQALEILDPEVSRGIRMGFTLSGRENPSIARLRRRIRDRKLPVEFIGVVTHDEVMERFTRSVLVFPSYIETFGLPLFEAKLTHTPILASDCPFSREILKDYDRVAFFAPHDAARLATLLAGCADGSLFQLEKGPDKV